MQPIEISKRATFKGHSSGIFCLDALTAHEFISAGGDGQLVMWNLKKPGDGQVIARMDSTIYGLRVDGRRLLVGENGRALHMIDLDDHKVLRSVEIKAPIFAIHREADRYLVGTGAGELFVFDLHLNFLVRHKLSAKSLRCIDSGYGEIACGFSDNIIRILDPETLEIKHELEGHTLSVFGLAYHPVARSLVSTGRDAHIRSWDLDEEYMSNRAVPAHMYASNHLVFHPDGHLFATGSMDKTIKIWDAANFALLKVIDKVRHDGHTNSVNKLLWMEFDNLLVTCSDDRTIAAWDIKANMK
jgi:WD40 repeat protein